MTKALDPGKVLTQLDYIQRDIAEIKNNDLREIKLTLKEMSDKQDKQDNRITSVETKVGIIGVISVAFTTLAASIAGYLGTRN